MFMAIIIFVAASGHCFALKIEHGKPVILVDVHPNSINSQKIQTSKGYLYNNGYDLMDQYGDSPSLLFDGITGNGAHDRPLVGITGVGDDNYHEWQLLTLRAADVDGVIVEWGFPKKITSSDKILASYRRILNRESLRNHSFAAVPAWLPNWTVQSSGLSTEQLQSVYESKINEITSRYYSDFSTITYNDKPLIFVLDWWNRRVLNRTGLRTFFENKTLNNQPQFIWRMGENKNSKFWSISDIPEIVGNLPWIVPRERTQSSGQHSFISHFDRFATQSDVRHHVSELNELNSKYGENLSLKVMSVTPGMDTRYAHWSTSNSVLMRENTAGENAFETGWKAILWRQFPKPDITIVETLDDFSESTHLEPTVTEGFKNIETLGEYACKLKLDDSLEPANCALAAKKTRALACQALKINKARKLLKVVRVVIPEKKHTILSSNIDYWSNQVFKRKISSHTDHKKRINNKLSKLPIKITKNEYELNYAIYPSSEKIFNMKNEIKNLPEELFTDKSFSISAIKVHLTRHSIKKDFRKYEQPAEVLRLDENGKETSVASLYLHDKTKTQTFKIYLDSPDGNGVLHHQYKIKSPDYRFVITQLLTESYSKSDDPDQPDVQWSSLIDLDEDCNLF